MTSQKINTKVPSHYTLYSQARKWTGDAVWVIHVGLFWNHGEHVPQLTKHRDKNLQGKLNNEILRCRLKKI